MTGRVPTALGAGLLALLLAVASATGQTPGTRHEIRPADMPAPGATPSASNRSSTVERPAGVPLEAPPGFEVTLVRAGLDGPRDVLALPNGDIVLTEPRAGRIVLLRDTTGDGVADERSVFADTLPLPYGLALADGHLYLSDARGIRRTPLAEGQTAAAGWEWVTGTDVFGFPGGHSTRSLAIGPDGRLYVGVGSAGNIAVEPSPRATIQVFEPDGSGQRDFATGIRNAIGIAFHPHTGELYTVVNERDGLGEDLVPDYLTRVEEGAFYGWPYAYIGPNPQPGFADRRPDLVEATVVPDVLFRSHSAPIHLAFYMPEDGPFPADWSDGAFVAFRGSWNRDDPTGYKVVFVPFSEGRPDGHYVDFLTGFRIGATSPARVWGRPTGVAVSAEGDLLVTDDTGGTLWRVRYTGG